MELHLIRGGNKVDLEAKKYNIGVGISLGSKWFTVENILELIAWSLKYTKESVVVYVADSIHAINIEVRKSISHEKALAISNNMGDEILESVKNAADAKFSSLDTSRITYSKWQALVDDSYRKNIHFLYDFYSKDKNFKDALMSITRNYTQKDPRSFTEAQLERLNSYLIEEFPELIKRVSINNIKYDAYVYPFDGDLVRLVEEIQNGHMFPEIKQHVLDTEPKVFLEVR